MKKTINSLLVLVLMASQIAVAQSNKKEFPNTEYWEVVSGRAAKIVKTMDLNDDQKELAVQNLIAGQYYHLNEIHDTTDARIARVKSSDLEKEKQDAAIAKLESSREKQLAKLHKSYLKGLSKELNEEQVTAVKNGMTYDVFTHTWNGYLDMLPDLTKAQKDYIYKALEEAREHAMDAGSSKAKHAWFGKYKGRINNYLSKEGYDLNKRSKEWQERLKAKGIQL